MRFLDRLKRSFREEPKRPPFSAPIAPNGDVIVVGDIHGSLHLLNRLLERIDTHIEAAGIAAPHLVFTGDYVDRGEDSQGVLRQIFELQQVMPDKVICLKGNHEQFMTKFLDDPGPNGARWFRNGGLQTLASYGIGNVTETSPAERLRDARDQLDAHLVDGQRDWLDGLPLMWRSGNLVVAHAGADPSVGFDTQKNRHLIWGHRDFLKLPRSDGTWVAHGHYFVDQAMAEDGRINVDSGACFTGVLSAAVIRPGSIEFLTSKG